MQTFLPVADFAESARLLDSPRLGKQRVETLQVLRALELPDYGWVSHPATWIVAADAATGERVVLGSPGAPRAGLGEAVAASWAIPPAQPSSTVEGSSSCRSTPRSRRFVVSGRAAGGSARFPEDGRAVARAQMPAYHE